MIASVFHIIVWSRFLWVSEFSFLMFFVASKSLIENDCMNQAVKISIRIM
ncbi:hypothetical protein AI2850V1_1680 [Klebsiella pneumoniae]|nr:hypothetical protein AI2850V1_1680 [Klebsiella pneumoniae]CAH5167969.1 hypothetical protein AI2850V1_1680 [Klebsiella pneumoniae]SYM49476.1 Uncharacterised protein [Klebsiella pneumoniae]SYM79931.1 Uncharacterised protein [Klebsiella pneumoniae]